LTRRALRWADAALRAARAPKGLASQATTDADWVALAALAWQACRDDWAAARGSLQPVGPTAGKSPETPSIGPACLAEALNG